MAVPVVFDTSVRPVFALPKFTLVVLGAFVVLALSVVEWADTRSWPWRNGLQIPVLLFVGWTAVSSAASEDPGQSLFGARESLNGLVTLAAFVVVFFAVAEAFDRRSARTALAVMWFGGGVVVLLYGAVQLRDRVVGTGRWDPVPWLNSPGEGAIWSTLGNPSDLAGFLAVLLPIGLAMLLTGRPSSLGRAVPAVMVGLLMVELVVTTSRGALLAAAAGVIAFGAWSRRDVANKDAVLVAVGAAVLGVTVGVGAHFAALPDYRSADVLVRTGEGTTPALRVELWRTAGRMAGEDPLTGVGPDGFGRAFDALRSERFVRAFGPELQATDAHNVFLTVLASSGFPGLLAFSTVVVSAFVRLRTTSRLADAPTGVPDGRVTDDRRVLTASVGAAMLAYLVQASFNRHDIALEFCFWFLLGLSCAFCDGERPAHATRRGRGLGADHVEMAVGR